MSVYEFDSHRAHHMSCPYNDSELCQKFGKLIDVSIGAICGIKFRASVYKLQNKFDAAEHDRQWLMFHRAEQLANNPKYWDCAIIIYNALDYDISAFKETPYVKYKPDLSKYYK